MSDSFQNYREWEVLDDKDIITNIIFENGHYGLNPNCTIKFQRDHQYKLSARITGIANGKDDLEPKEVREKGHFLLDESIHGNSIEGLYKYKLSGIAIGDYSSSPASMTEPIIRFDARLIIDSIEKVSAYHNSEIESLCEWFITSKSQFLFPRFTHREVEKNYKKNRKGIDSEEEISKRKIHGSHRDYFLVETGELKFIVAEVPKDYPPSWSYNVCIEYRKSFGKIPDVESRKAISEFVGFIFGAQLLKIGSSGYDDANNIVSQIYQHPWGDNIISKCKKPTYPPIEIRGLVHSAKIETLFNRLLPEYLKLRETHNLSGIIWKYWLGRDATMGINLPILSSGLDSLVTKILANNKEHKQYYIEQNEFIKLISEELASIEKKLTAYNFKDILLRKVKGASLMGANEKIDLMFKILELPVGKIERDALKSRNKLAHSSELQVDDDEIMESIQLYNAYLTLYHRVLLKLLGYKEDYIDYYSNNHPSRKLDEPIS